MKIKKTYVDFAQDGETDAIVDQAELLNLLICPGILAAELVAREAQELDVVTVRFLQVCVQLLKAGKLWGKAAF